MAEVSDLSRYKNRLQELMQKSNLDVPVYQTIAQGVQPQTGFKSSVVVDQVHYTSEKIFPNRKAAEQHIAMVAFEGASQKIKDEALSIIYKDPVFCKSIVNEYATKMNIEKPVYHTFQAEVGLPLFTSSLVFNEIKYTGEVCRTKKDSEQLAARSLILSILGRSDTGIMMSEIIKSKSKKHYDLLNRGRNVPIIAPHDYVVAEVVNPETNLVIPPESQVEELVVVTSTDDNSKGLLLPPQSQVEELVIVTRIDDISKGLLLPPTTTVHHHDPIVAKVKTESNLVIQSQIEGKESEMTRNGGDNISGDTLQLVSSSSSDEKPLAVEGGGDWATGKRSHNNNTGRNNKKVRHNAQVESSVAEIDTKMVQVQANVVVHSNPAPSCSVGP